MTPSAETHGSGTSGAENEEREIVLTRIFDAPRALVYRMWTEPEHVQAWWGPEGFRNPSVELDVRPGGLWQIDMQGPDGSVYPCRGVYLEVSENERLVYSDTVAENALEWEGHAPPDSVNTVVFEDAGEGKTRLTLTTVVGSLSERHALLRRGYAEGMGQSLNRLQAHLGSL